jgi:hypothetical protein
MRGLSETPPLSCRCAGTSCDLAVARSAELPPIAGVLAVLGGRDGLGGAPITVGPHALIHHNAPSGEAGKRRSGETEAVNLE